MSSIHGTIRRYQLIIDKLNRKQYPPAKELLDFIHDNDFPIAMRTLQRDINDLRSEFGVKIQYNRTRNGYYISAESDAEMEQFLRLANMSQMMQLMAVPRNPGKNKLAYIHFESQGQLQGLHHLPKLFGAIDSQRKIIFSHTSFYRDEPKNYGVKPFLLKEYQKRWYLIGWVDDEQDFRNFGVDRIHEMQVTNEAFDRNEHPDPTSFFEHTIGLTYSLHEVEDVELLFDQHQGKYIKTLPLHHSQVILEDDKNGLHIRLKLRPNFEFQQIILSYGEKVKVLQPAWLAEEITLNLRNNLHQYE